MPKQNTRRRTKRVKNLMVVSTLTAVLLAISTYAWFIGMRTVHVEAFEVEIAATESLLLSFDGERFEETVHISKDMLENVSYENHTNKWSDLVPVSSIGQMDKDSSRMMLFEKASLTASKGGYRLLASRVKNNENLTPETHNKHPEGYVVFDLFIKNKSGNEYIDVKDIRNEEAIYLTTDSAVTVAEGGTEETGIENSVRVAFAQIGRVNAIETEDGNSRDSSPDGITAITGITCADAEGDIGVTGICRTAQIWEPNDKDHVEGAIKWFGKSCLQRNEDGDDVTEKASFGEPCAAIENDETYPTYAISKEILKEESYSEVDIYDGPKFNTYTETITQLEGPDYAKLFHEELEKDEPSLNYLTEVPYFTDSMKVEKGTKRDAFMYLAPNSVTKVRVYIYLEGQDIDNYDFAQIGKKISVKFGFTKERFTPTDIEYGDGPALDFDKPEIALSGDGVDKKDGKYTMTATKDEEFTSPEVTVTDEGGSGLKTFGDEEQNYSVNFEALKLDEEGKIGADAGTHVVYFYAEDEAGNRQTQSLIVTVLEN